jgi:hypothetical protein
VANEFLNINGEYSEMKRWGSSWALSQYLTGEAKKITWNLGQYYQYLGRDSNPGPPSNGAPCAKYDQALLIIYLKEKTLQLHTSIKLFILIKAKTIGKKNENIYFSRKGLPIVVLTCKHTTWNSLAGCLHARDIWRKIGNLQHGLKCPHIHSRDVRK